MAIKVSGTDVIYQDQKSNFNRVNIGSYTRAQLEANAVTGRTTGTVTFCTDSGANGKIVSWNGSEWNDVRKADISGGTPVGTFNGYKYYVFTSPGTVNVNSSGVVEYLIVAGGGGGGTGTGGGGGGGGVLKGSQEFSSPQPVIVGNGSPRNPFGVSAKNGSNSSVGSVTAYGGGAGISGSPSGLVNAAGDGGSGGGGGQYQSYMQGPGGSGTTNQGNPGGYAPNGGGGGGGSGAAGAAGPGGDGAPHPEYGSPIVAPAIPGPLRPAFVDAVGSNGTYGGGGAGCASQAPYPGGSGGGAPTPGNTGNDGTAYTGGGGSGGWAYSGSTYGGAGGTGIVILRCEV